MQKPRNIIGGQVQKIRSEQGISQTELAAICQRKGWNISRNIVAKIESSSRCVTDFETMLLADALKTEVNALMPSKEVWKANKGHFMAAIHAYREE